MESFLRNVDGVRLKTRLNQIMAEAGAFAGDTAASLTVRNTEDAGHCILKFVSFFLSVAEQYGTTPHAVLGQHVVSNVLIFVLERVVKPNLQAYTRVAEKHASNALAACGDLPNAVQSMKAHQSSGTASVTTGRRDALEARRRRLRGDIIRPFIQLFQSLHASLAEEGEPLTSWYADGSGTVLGATRVSAAVYSAGMHDDLLTSASPTNAPPTPSSSSASASASRRGRRGDVHGDDRASAEDVWGTDDGADRDTVLLGGFGSAFSAAPLQWKNSSPLNILCNHILEVFESQWLVAVVGGDYAALFLEVLRWSGYVRLITPTYLVRLTQCLISLVRRVSVEADKDTDVFAVSSNVVAQEVAGGRLWVAAPSADDACLYAQVITRLCALPQMTTAYPPSSSSETDLGRRGGGGGVGVGGSPEALALVRRLVELVKERHQSPTLDLRLEAYCIASLRQVCHRFRYDHPVAARESVTVVKLLCDFFFLPHHTPRHDVWRLETMQFLSVVVSVALANVVGEELWHDLHAHSHRGNCVGQSDSANAVGSPVDGGAHQTANADGVRCDCRTGGGVAELEANALLQPPARDVVVLLHQSVFPTMQRIFTQHRHEYCFTSRRELFSVPCLPLKDVFEFGAVVLYITSLTHNVYSHWRAAQTNLGEVVGTSRASAVAVLGTHMQSDANKEEGAEGERRRAIGPETRRASKRPRGVELGTGGAAHDTGRCRASDAAAAPPIPSPLIPHPAQLLAERLQLEFFMPPAPLEDSVAAVRHDDPKRAGQLAGTLTRRQAGQEPLVLRMGASNIRTSSAAVQDIVSDTALYLLHLFAQPCATLRMPTAVADCLVEDVIIPLCRDFGLRLGQLLLAALRAVVCRCGRATQHFAFSVVAQRSLPTMGILDVARWASHLDCGSGGFVPRNDEDVLAPSEPVYHVLVALLQQHLHRRKGLGSPNWDRGGSARRGRSTDASASVGKGVSGEGLLSGLSFFWGAHHRALTQQAIARVQTWEQDVRRTIEGPGSAASLPGATTEAERCTSAPGSVPNGQLSFVPVSLALLLTHFALLVQCTRLWRMCWTSSISVPLGCAATEAEWLQCNFIDHGNSSQLSGVPSGDIGLTFLCQVAAHTTFFYAAVPVIVRPSETGGSHNDVSGSSMRAFRPTADVGVDLLTVTSATMTGSSAMGADNAAASFSAPQFLAWLDLAERYAVAASYVSLARQHVMEQSEMDSAGQSGGAASLEGVSSTFASPTMGAPRLRGLLRDEVCAYVERVCAVIDTAVSLPSSQVPSVLRDAADAHWMLRLSGRTGAAGDDRGVSISCTEEPVSASCDSADASVFSAALGTRPAEHLTALPHRGVSRTFCLMLASSVQTAVAWLMRRDQLTRALEASAAATGSHLVGDHRGGGGPLDAHTTVRLTWNTSAIALHLSVQCVQLLHLLLRWRRCGLWSPPEDGGYGGTHSCTAGKGGLTTPDVATGKPVGCSGPDGAEGSTEGGGDPDINVDAGEETLATRADVSLLRASPDLYEAPLSLLERFSAVGGGRIYYSVLWLCHHLVGQLDDAHMVGSHFPLWAALCVMYRDVGMVLMDPKFACIDPRHTIVRFTAAVTARLFKDGLCGLSRWRPSNPTSREVTHIMAVALHTSIDTLRIVLWTSFRTRIGAYTTQTLVNTSVLYRAVVAILCEQSLLDVASAGSGEQSCASKVPGDVSAGVALDDILLPNHHRLLEKHPFLPTVLRVLPALLRLLALIGCFPAEVTAAPASVPMNMRCCRSVIQVLQILFARYRYQLGPGLCSEVLCGTVADVRQLLLQLRSTAIRGGDMRGLQGFSDAAAFLFAHEGRLLELWTAQLTDSSRVDMPVCTPAWQCACLQASFVLLPGCEPVVAEVLGRTSFELLAEKTPYAVRLHAAQQVGALFHTFSARRARVLRTLLTKAREGMLASSSMLCSTSLLALSEAVRAAPELLVDVLYTLLECWATQGFTHHQLVVECLERLSTWALEDATLTVAPVSGVLLPHGLPYTQLCRMYVRPLLFLWLCEYRHPLAALPVECFGYKAQTLFVIDHLSVLSPLALLLLTESRDAQWSLFDCGSSRDGPASAGAITAAGDDGLYKQLLSTYSSALLGHIREEDGKEREVTGSVRRRRRAEAGECETATHRAEIATVKPNASATTVCETEVLFSLAPLCMLLTHFPGIVTQLLVLASHTPVSLFTGDAAGLDIPGHAGGTREHVAFSHRQQNADSAAGFRVSSGGNSDSAGVPATTLAWASVAQRCLYWLEAQLNTTDTSLLTQSAGLLLGGHSCSNRGPLDTNPSDAAGRGALCHPTAASHASEVLLYYLQHRSAHSHSTPLFSVLVAAQMDALMEALVALHGTTAEPSRLVYGTPEQLRHSMSWLAERVTALPVCMPDCPNTGARLAGSGESCDPAMAVEGGTAQAVTSGCTENEFAEEGTRCLALLVPPAVAMDARGGDPSRMCAPNPSRSTDAVGLTEDPLTRLLLLGNSTFLYALLHAVYRSSTTPSSVELQLRAPQQISLLVHICTRWCSSRVLGHPDAARMTLLHLLHWLRRSPAVLVRQLVCSALLHVWPVARSGCFSVLHGEAPGRARLASLRRCRLMLARSIAPLTSVSPLIASTWAALCRSDPALLRWEWVGRTLVQTPPERHPKETVAEAAGGGETPALGRCVVDVDDATDDEGGKPHEDAVDGEALGTSVGVGATPTRGGTSLDCTLLQDAAQWTRAAYEANRFWCLAPLSQKQARERLLAVRRLLQHVLGFDEEGSDDDVEGVPEGVGDEGDDAVLDKCLLPERSFVPVHNQSEGINAVLLQYVTATVDSAQPLLVRCLQVAAVCLRTGYVSLTPAEATAKRHTSKHTAGSLQLAELMAVEVRSAVLDSIQHLYHMSHLGVPLLPTGCADALEQSRSLSGGYGTGHVGPGVGPTVSPLLSSDAADDQLLAAFRLLRALSFCVVLSGEAVVLPQCVASMSSTPSAEGPGAVWSMCDELRRVSSPTAFPEGSEPPMAEDDFLIEKTAEDIAADILARAYTQQLSTLEQLVWCADADASALGMCALRLWVSCLVSYVERGEAVEQIRPAGTLSGLDEGIVQLMIGAWEQRVSGLLTSARDPAVSSGGQSKTSPNAQIRRFLQRRFLWVMRSSSSTLRTSLLRSGGGLPGDAADAHLSSSSVWRPLRQSPPNQRAFLCRFVLAAGNTYGLWRQSILWGALVPLLMAELRASEVATSTSTPASGEVASDADGMPVAGGGAGIHVRMAEQLLLPVLLHALCSRESEGQRAMRREWSKNLDTFVFEEPRCAAHTARVFLRVLEQCFAVLLRATRHRGLKGAKAACSSRTKTSSVSSAALASGDQALVKGVVWPSALGSVPSLQDMEECYWLSDIPPARLARAASQVGESHVALLFSQISGESLYGSRTGAAALCSEGETTRSALMLRDGASAGEAILAVSSAPYSVLFPLAKATDYPSASSVVHASGAGAARSSGGRARERHEAVREKTRSFAVDIFELYDSVQAQLDLDDVVGVSAMMRLQSLTVASHCGCTRRECTLNSCSGALPLTTLSAARRRSSGSTIRRVTHAGEGGSIFAVSSATGANDSLSAGPFAAAAWLDELLLLEERETRHSGGRSTGRDVSSARATAESGSGGESAGATEPMAALRERWPTQEAAPWAVPLQRATLLLLHGFPRTALDVLLNVCPSRRRCETAVLRQRDCCDGASDSMGDAERSVDVLKRGPVRSEASVIAADGGPSGVSCAPISDGAADDGFSWTSPGEASFQSLLAEAAWRCGQWSRCGGVGDGSPTSRASMCVPREVLQRLSLGRNTMAPPPWSASSTPTSAGTFYVHLLYSFLALHNEQPLLSMHHVRRAESALRQQLSPTTLVTTVMAAEALNEVRDCAMRFLAVNSDKSTHKTRGFPAGCRPKPPSKPSRRVVELPVWLRYTPGDSSGQASKRGASGSWAPQVPSTVDYSSRELLYSVRHALCQVYGNAEGWYRCVLGSTEEALLSRDAATAHRWLSDWMRENARGVCSEAGQAEPLAGAGDEPKGEKRVQVNPMDLALRRAQIAYGLGRWQEALALLQIPTAAAVAGGSPSDALHTVAQLRTAPGRAPQEPRVIQQLMLWHSDLQLLPPSQLVRDPFLSRAAASDDTGACSFLLARLCHTLADEIVIRLTSHEHQQLRDSVEESKELKASLEAQLEAAMQTNSGRAGAPPHGPSSVVEPGASTGATTTAAMPTGPQGRGRVTMRAQRGRSAVSGEAVPSVILSEDQLRVIRRRIRELAGDIKRLEDEWYAEKSNLGLYRRSAINAYSRFLQFHHAAQHSAVGSAAGCPNRSASSLAEVPCLPADPEEDTIHAVFGFVELWVNVADMDCGGNEVLGKVLDKAVERIPTAVFVPLAAQLTAQLGDPHEGERLAYLVSRLARDYPMHVVWPLLALCHGHTFAKSSDVNTLHKVDGVKMTAARALLVGLASAQINTKTSNRTHDNTSAASLFSKQLQHAQLLSSAYLEFAFDRSAATAQTNKKHPIRRDFMLMKDVRHLSIPPPTSVDPAVIPPIAGGAAVVVPHVMRYLDFFTTPGGVNVPKVLRCELSDGSVVRQLLKAGDDLRQDALIEQVFTTANRLFRRRTATRPLRIRTFTIVPLAPTAGILQWVEHTIPLGEYLTGRCAGREEHPGAHERYFPGEPTSRECRLELQSAPQSSRCQVLLSLYQKFTPALHYFFLEEYSSASMWVDRQQAFTRSVAASSVVGYVVGLGDRHINNILLHKKTAEVVHIDLGIAFDQNKLLPVPELVPFRLTRNVIDGLGVRGTEGSLRPCAEAAMHLLRGKRELVRTILGSIMHDPLARWVIGAPTITIPVSGDGGDVPHDSRPRQHVPLRTHGSTADAARTLARIDMKLRGNEGGDTLSVPTHVRKLIEEAQRVESLALMFPGWSQWV